MTTIVEQLAGLSAQIRYETLPPAVVRKARMTILDTLGCALGGCSSDPAKAMRRVARQLGGNPEATILGTAERMSVLGATWANGTSIRYLDYNDTLMSRDPSHPSGNLASVLAMAEAQGLDGRELICGLVNAYEVQLRLVDHCGEPCLWTRGWDHPTNMVYASAAAAARLRWRRIVRITLAWVSSRWQTDPRHSRQSSRRTPPSESRSSRPPTSKPI